MKGASCLLSIVLLCGCEDVDFTPYDYEKNEGAKFEIPGCEVGIHSDSIKLEKKIRLPVKQQ